MSAASPVRLHVYFKLSLADAQAWRERWRAAARRACTQAPGLQIVLSERAQEQMTWMESYRGISPEQMVSGEAAMERALHDLAAQRHREAFVETFKAP